MPFVVLSYRADVAEIAAELGAVAGVRKPINAGLLMTTVRRIVEREGN